MKLFNKQGAMFGLDARIALAIFGALSVISGAALYSAIKGARVTSSMVRLEETAKAVEAFTLDTGGPLDMHDTVNMNPSQLVTSTKAGWQGPYLPYEINNSLMIMDKGTPVFNYFIHRAKSTGLGGVIGGGSNGALCTSQDDCFYWLKTHVLESDGLGGLIAYSARNDLVLALDEKIDGSDGLDKGKFRVNYYAADSTDPIIFYQVMPAFAF